MLDAYGGYWQNDQSAVPLRPGAASIVIYKNGRVDMVKWHASEPGPDVAGVRHNLGLLVHDGKISPNPDSTKDL